MKVEEIEALIKEKQSELFDLKEKRFQMRVDAHKEATGLFEGCNVLIDGKKAHLIRFYDSYDKIGIVYSLYLKDGKLGATKKSWSFMKIEFHS